MPVPEPARTYLLTALSGSPTVLAQLVRDLDDDSPVWDRRPEPDRFSLREVVAHLADWEPIWLERVQRFVREDHPFLPSVDEGALAKDNHYESKSPSKCLIDYADGRTALVEYMRTVPEAAWDRMGMREFVGELSLYQQVVMALGHDGYHFKQVVDWVNAT